MCFDQTKTTSREYGKIDYTRLTKTAVMRQFGFEVDHIGDDLELLGASGPFGFILHHEIREDNFRLWHSRYLFHKDMSLIISSKHPALALSFVLKNKFSYRLRGFSEATMRERQFNMIYIPRLKCEYAFQKDEEYSLFGIQFNPDYLERWAHSYPALNELLKKVESNRPSMICTRPPSLSYRMKMTIEDILKCMYATPHRRLLMESKTLELLEAALSQMITAEFRSVPASLSEADLDKIRQVYTYLHQHLEESHTLKSLAQEVGTNTFKLKTGFKQLYRTSVFAFLREERLQKARGLLYKTDLPVYKISALVGYKNHANFSATFKKRFGFPPSKLRQ